MSNLARRLPPLSTLVVFEAAFRLRSFTRAADEVALSQASVSRRIRQLETNLGVRLFDRQRHSVLPTTEGNALAASVQLTLHELAATAERLRSIGAGSKNFVIYSDISIAAMLITPILGKFQDRNPDIQLRVLSSYESLENTTEDFDIGFQVGRVAKERFHIEPIADDAIFPVCSPEFASRIPSPIGSFELSKQPLLHLEYAGRDWPDWRSFLALFQIKEPKPIDGLVFNSYQVCLEAAERGEGIALGWARTVKAKLDEGKLVRISGMTMPLPDSICVYRSKHKKPSPIADEFIKIVRASIEPLNIV